MFTLNSESNYVHAQKQSAVIEIHQVLFLDMTGET